MADETGATEAQAATDTQPPAGSPPTQADGGKEEEQPQPESISLEEAKKLRKEHASLRKRLAEYEEVQQQAERAKLSEAEKLQQRIADLEREKAEAERVSQEARVREAVKDMASRLGFADARDAYARLMTYHAAELEYDETGAPTNADRLLGQILKDNRHLAVSSGGWDGAEGGNAPANVGPGRDRLANYYETSSKTRN